MNTETIELFDLRPSIEASRSRFMEELRVILRSGRFIGGEVVQNVQYRIGKLTGTPMPNLPLNSGTDALYLGLRALKIVNGWKHPIALVPDFTFQATPNAALDAGYEVLLVDISEDYCMDWRGVQWALCQRLLEKKDFDGVVIIPVHLYGNICDVQEIRKHAVDTIAYGQHADQPYILEDAAQGLGGVHHSGHAVGSLGDLTALSFFPTKPFGGYGDGGMLIATERGLPAMETAIKLSRQGLDNTKSFSTTSGINSRLDAIQAAAVLQKLHAPLEIREHRQNRLEAYLQCLQGIPHVTPITKQFSHPPDASQSCGLTCPSVLTVEFSSPEHVDCTIEALYTEGIKTGRYYPTPLHKQPAYESLRFYTYHSDPISYEYLPVSASIAQRCLSLPFFWGITDQQIERVVSILRSVMEIRHEKRARAI